MWSKSDNISSLRFSKMDRDNLIREGWTEFNADNYGSYRIQDVRNDVNLIFSVIREDNDLSFRIEGDSVSMGENNQSLTLLFYMYPKAANSSFKIDCPSSAYSGIVFINL